MTDIRLDHVITFTNVEQIDQYMELYRLWGFDVTDETRPYKPGLRNRFVNLGCEYLEFVWVENESAFASGGHEEFARMFPDLSTYRTASRPFGIGFKSSDVHALNQTWTQQGYLVPSVWSFAPPNHPPVFSFQQIPQTVLPYVGSFALTYHGVPDHQSQVVQIAPNTVYAMDSITFVSETPAADALRWRDLLVPTATVHQAHAWWHVEMGAHTIQWTTPTSLTSRYGLPWKGILHPTAHLACIDLLATSIDIVQEKLGDRAKRMVDPQTQTPCLVIDADARDGFAFTVRQRPIAMWQEARTAKTHETFIIRPTP